MLYIFIYNILYRQIYVYVMYMYMYIYIYIYIYMDLKNAHNLFKSKNTSLHKFYASEKKRNICAFK